MLRNFQFPANRPLGFKAWLTLGLALILTVGILFVLAVIALGAFLVILPVLLIMIAVYALSPKRKPESRRRRAGEPTVVDGEFRVVDSPERDQDRSGGKD